MPDEGVQTVPLSTFKSGVIVKLVSVGGGHGLRARLASMGLLPGVEVEIKSDSSRGPLILAILGGRVMLGRGMAEKILVREIVSGGGEQ